MGSSCGVEAGRTKWICSIEREGWFYLAEETVRGCDTVGLGMELRLIFS